MDEMDSPKCKRNPTTLTFERSELMNRLRLFTILIVAVGLTIGMFAVAAGQQWQKDEGFYLRVPPSGSPEWIPSQYQADYDYIDTWTRARPDSIIYNNELGPDAAFLRFDVELQATDASLDSMLLTIRAQEGFDPNVALKRINPATLPYEKEEDRALKTGIQFYVEQDPPSDRNPDEFDYANIAVKPQTLDTLLTDFTWNDEGQIGGGTTDHLWTATFVFKTPIDIDVDASHAVLNFTRIWVIVQTQGCHMEDGRKERGLSPIDTFAVMLDSEEDFFASFWDFNLDKRIKLFPSSDIVVNDQIRPDWCDQNAWEDETPNPPWEGDNRWSCATPVHGYDDGLGPQVVAGSMYPLDGSYTSDSMQVITFKAFDDGQCIDWCNSYVLIDTCGGQSFADFDNDGTVDTLWMYRTIGPRGVISDMCFDPTMGPIPESRYYKGYGFTVFLGEDCRDSVKIAPGLPQYGGGGTNFRFKDGWNVSVHVYLVDQSEPEGIWSTNINWAFWIDRTPPGIGDTWCMDSDTWTLFPRGYLCYTSNPCQPLRWEIEDRIGQACKDCPTCIITPSGLFSEGFRVRVDVYNNCSGSNPASRGFPREYIFAGELISSAVEETLTDRQYLTWNPFNSWSGELIFLPPCCNPDFGGTYYHDGDSVRISIEACDKVNVPWHENSCCTGMYGNGCDEPCWPCIFERAKGNGGCAGKTNPNCDVLTTSFRVDMESPRIVNETEFPEDNSYISDSCTPIAVELEDYVCSGGMNWVASGVGGAYMKIKVTDRDGNLALLDVDGNRITAYGHGAPFDREHPETNGWFDAVRYRSGNRILYNPPDWITKHETNPNWFPFYDGDHVCVMIVPYDLATCCGNIANYGIPPYTWEFNIDEYAPELVDVCYDTWHIYCCELRDTTSIGFTVTDIPLLDFDFGDPMDWWNSMYIQLFNCLSSGVEAESLYMYIAIEGDTLPLGGLEDGKDSNKEKIWLCNSYYFDSCNFCLTKDMPELSGGDFMARCGNEEDLCVKFNCHLSSSFRYDLMRHIDTTGVDEVDFHLRMCDNAHQDWHPESCQCQCPGGNPNIEPNCRWGHFTITIEDDADDHHKYWSFDFWPYRYDDSYITPWMLYKEHLDVQGDQQSENDIHVNGPVIGGAMGTNTDMFDPASARMTIWVTRKGVKTLAFDAFCQTFHESPDNPTNIDLFCDECPLHCNWWSDGTVCCPYNTNSGAKASNSIEEKTCGFDDILKLNLVLATVWNLGPQSTPIRDDINERRTQFFPSYLHFEHCDYVEVVLSARSFRAKFGEDRVDCTICPPPNEPPGKEGNHVTLTGPCGCYGPEPDYLYIDRDLTFTVDMEGPYIADMNLHTVKGYEDISSCNLNPHQLTDDDFGNFQLWLEGIYDDPCGVGFNCLCFENSSWRDMLDGWCWECLFSEEECWYSDFEAYLVAQNTLLPDLYGPDWHDYRWMPRYCTDDIRDCMEDPECPDELLPDWVKEWAKMDKNWWMPLDMEPYEGVECWFKIDAQDDEERTCVYLDVPEDTLFALIFVSDELGNINVIDSRDYGQRMILDNIKPIPEQVSFAYDAFGEDPVSGGCEATCNDVATLTVGSKPFVFITFDDQMDVTSDEYSVKFQDAAGMVWTVRGVTQDDYPKGKAEGIEVTRPGWIGSTDRTWVGVIDLAEEKDIAQGCATLLVYRFRDTACNKMKPWECKFKIFRGCEPASICHPKSDGYISGYAANDSCSNEQADLLLCAYLRNFGLDVSTQWQYYEGGAWVDILSDGFAYEHYEVCGDTCDIWNHADLTNVVPYGSYAVLESIRVITTCPQNDQDISPAVYNVTLDNDPPDAEILNPIEGQVVTADYLSLMVDVDDICLTDTVWHYSLDDGETWNKIFNPDYWAPENTLAEYWLRVMVYDCAGLVGCDDVHFFWRAITVYFERGGRGRNDTPPQPVVDAFQHAIDTEWPGTWRLVDGTIDDLTLVPITTYVYDPGCDLYWDPCQIRGSLYPGDHVFVTYKVRTGTPIDSIKTHIPAKGTSNFPKHPIYRAIGPEIGEWVVLTNYFGFDYYGYDWLIFDESRFDDGLWTITSEIYVAGDSTPFPDEAFIILDSEDPQYHITYSYHNAPSDSLLPTIMHPTFGEIPVTNKRLVDIHIDVDQTVTEDLGLSDGNGRLWSWMDIFITGPGELLDIDGVPACGDMLVPCGPGETFDRWMNEPPWQDTTNYHYTWNVQNADQTTEGVFSVFIKGRDTAGNIVDIHEGQFAGNTGLEIYVDITAPTSPLETAITVCDDGNVTGEAGAVGQDHFGLSLMVTIYGNSMLTDVLAEITANSDGSFSGTISAPLTAGEQVYVSASDAAGNESAAIPIMVEVCEVPFSFSMNLGWNMVSVPVVPDDATLTTLFPEAQAMWKYNGNYQPATEGVTGEGYWLLYGEAETEEIMGLPVRSFQKELVPGWNLLGSCIEDVSISTIIDVATDLFPAWINPMDVYKWEGQYFPTGTIAAGGAVWMLAQEAGTIEVFVSDGDILAREPITVELIKPTWLAEITAQSASVVKRVEFGAERTATNAYDNYIDRAAPPAPPASNLTVHFEGEFAGTDFYRDIRGLEDNHWTLHVKAQSTVALAWDVTAIPQEMGARLRVDGIDVDMRSQSSISLAKGSHDLDISVNVVPKAFELAQNYPNPFNPETNISYGLPEDATVVLKVYNMLGQEIRTLANEQQPAGYYTVTWDGTNESGETVSTGVYIYRLTAGQYTESKRMILVK